MTCDELLRGERKSPTERAETTEETVSTPKVEKQCLRLLKSTLSQYQNRTYIAMGFSVIGIIVALVCNLAFLKAILGFFLEAIFFAVSIVCQTIFVNKAFFSVEDGGLDKRVLSDFKRKVINFAETSIGLTVTSLGFTLPLVLVDASLLKKGMYGLSEQEEALTRRLEDKNGNVVCEYIDRNEKVVSLRYTPKDGTILPITVCTEDDLQKARQTAAVRHVIFGVAYCIECLAVVLIYFKKRAK